jgi:hypothetical protein
LVPPPSQNGGGGRLAQVKGRKDFFFEKKAKNFCTLEPRQSDRRGSQGSKVFWFFFSKKTGFLP